jgi:radical SAM superfamily enzyme YgiQ (UPF0313 family)
VIGLDPHLVLALDREGRPWRLVDGPRTCRWGLNGRILTVTRTEDGSRRYRWIELEEAVALWQRTRQRLAPLFAAGTELERNLVRIGEELPADEIAQIVKVLRRTGERNSDRQRDEADRFTRIWTPVGILPPDQYLALQIQLTEGCRFNTCTFCGFYREVEYRVKTPAELRIHLQAIDDFLGEGLGLRRSLFLGDANALALEMAELMPLLELIGRHYAGHPRFERNLHSFQDAFTGARRSAADYARLREQGLVRICVGLESGHDPLLKWLRKPGRAADVAAAVRAMKAGGVAVSLTVLLGAGGRQYAADHERDTTALLADLPLDGDDILYFSELVDLPAAPYVFHAQVDGIDPLDPQQLREQRERIATAPEPHRSGGPRQVTYDIREFSY